MGDINNSKPILPFAAAAVVAMVACGGVAIAQDGQSADEGAYWTNADGEVWVNPDGDCWQSPNQPKEELRAECGDVVQAEEPEPPEPQDSDGDGVPDSRDQCPGTPPGTPVDSNGCPEQKEAPVVLKGVQFEFDSARLTPEAEDRLDNVVNALKAASQIDVRIEGHTDSIGSASYNMDLSQRRADSVKAYLVNHGISGARLVTRGYGESQPVASNETEAGRAQNRRVELHVIDQ